MSLPIDRSEVTPIRTQRVPQTIETPVTFTPVPSAYVRFAYSRSSDSMASQIEGQDYLCFRHNDQRLVFVVADGVGSSFCGNLAARILGDELLDWLWSADVGYFGGPAALKEAATAYLNKIQKQAQMEVEEYELPDNMSPLIAQALESQRAYGSEAIFAAGRIDHPGPVIPEGLVSAIWMGDTEVRVLDIEGQPLDLGGHFDLANRWSTVKGVRGEMNAWMRSLDGVGRMAAFTDGLSAHAEGVLGYPDAKLDREISRGSLEPTSDDVAFIDVVLRTPTYEGYPDPDLPDPNLARPHLEQIWNPTGEPTYELRWTWPGDNGGRISYIIQEATNPSLTDSRTINVPQGETSWRPAEPQEPGHYYYRVRGVKRFGGVTPWSELRQTQVAYPPPPAPTLHPVEPEKSAVLHWEVEGEVLTFTLERAEEEDFSDSETVFEGRSTAWAIPTDQPGTYFFRVRATSDGGEGPWSDPQQVTITLPPPPTPSLGSIVQSGVRGEYTLRWQPVPRATIYELEKVTRGSADDDREVIETGDTAYQVTGETVGEYVYRVRACHDHGCSAWSNEQIAVVAPEAPTETPTLTLEGPDPEQVLHLSWTPVAEAAEYLIDISTDADFLSAQELVTDETSHDLTRRDPGAVYVRVCGANRGGEGPWSNVVHASLEPPVPEWIEVTLDDDAQTADVTWAAVGGSITYRVEIGVKHGDDFAHRKIYSGEGTHATAPIPADAERVAFRVRAEAPGVASAWQKSRVIRAQSTPAAPALDAPQVTERGEIKLTWGAAKNAASYVLEVSQKEDFSGARQIDVPGTSYVYAAPGAGQYRFRLRAKHSDGTLSEPGPARWQQVRRPATPKLWPAGPVPAGESFKVTWAGIPGCAYYEVQSSESKEFPSGKTRSKRIFHPAQEETFEGREPGVLYVRVKAVDEEGQSSVWSDVIEVKIE